MSVVMKKAVLKGDWRLGQMIYLNPRMKKEDLQEYERLDSVKAVWFLLQHLLKKSLYY